MLGQLLYLGAGCSAAALLPNGYALARLDVGRAAVVLNLGPVVGLAAAALVLGEPLAAGHAVGAALIVGGAVRAGGSG